MKRETPNRPPRGIWTHDLSPRERRFAAAMNELGYGYLEAIPIRRGELVLDPWPRTVRTVRPGSGPSHASKVAADAFELKPALIDFFQHVRSVDDGEILRLEVRRGLPATLHILFKPAGSKSDGNELTNSR